VPRGEDQTLRNYKGPIRLAADESVADRAGLKGSLDMYQVVNVKLDKTGGLTEATGAGAARPARWDCKSWLGCMAGTSLAMAPGMVVGQLASLSTWMARSCTPRTASTASGYDRGLMQLPTAALWG